MHQQGPEFNGYLVGRGNSRDIDLNRNFPDLNGLMYYYEKTNGRNHHLPLPDNWEQQVSQCCWETRDLTSPVHVQSTCLCWRGQRVERKTDEHISHTGASVCSVFECGLE